MNRSMPAGVRTQKELCAQLVRDLDVMRDSVVRLSLALRDYRFHCDTEERQKARAIADHVIEQSKTQAR